MDRKQTELKNILYFHSKFMIILDMQKSLIQVRDLILRGHSVIQDWPKQCVCNSLVVVYGSKRRNFVSL